jgi:hypothetical protein
MTISGSRKFTTPVALACCVALSTLSPFSARAAVLEEKWQAGQQLSYDLTLDGTLHLTAPADAPMIGGLPLEILLKGDGQNTLDTRSVDEFGTAIVALRLDRLQLKMNETTFNQNGVFGIREGRANFSLNGQSLMPARDISQYLAPRYGLRITKQFHVVGAPPLATTTATATDAGDAKTGDDKSPIKIPLQTLTLMQAMMARSLPPLLPSRDVNIGDTWTANVEWPQVPNAPKSEAQKPVGAFNLKAIGEEEVLGRKTWRIAFDGTVQLDEAQAKLIGDEIEKTRDDKGKAANRPAVGGMQLPKLFTLVQKVKGDLWFDAVAGQIVRTDLQLTSNGQTRKDEKSKADGDFDFSGNLKMELRKISYESQPNP